MKLPPDNDIDHSWMWHHQHWNMEKMEEVIVPSHANIIKYQKADWLYGLRERKLPSCLLHWPLAKIDEIV